MNATKSSVMGASLACLMLFATCAQPQTPAAAAENPTVPPRSEGEGPYQRLILRGVYVIDGTGAPIQGPADIVVVRDRIAEVRFVGYPQVPIDPQRRPPLEGGREIDLEGMYVMPGFIDTHVHLHSLRSGQKVLPEYPMKLWFAHGVTTARALGPHDQATEWLMDVKRRSDRNEVTGPRVTRPPRFLYSLRKCIHNR